jgi:hypothetical protein
MQTKDIKPAKEYFIRAFIADQKNVESETGLLGWDWGCWTTHSIGSARNWGSREKALEEIKKIVEEKPAKMSDGKVYPPNEIHRIGGMCNHRNKIEFRLSVVEFDVEHISMKELDYYVGTVSFENPQIILTAKGVVEEK